MCRKQRANNAFARCLVDNLAVMQDSESLTIFMEHVKTCSHLAGILSILKTFVFVFTFLISSLDLQNHRNFPLSHLEATFSTRETLHKHLAL